MKDIWKESLDFKKKINKKKIWIAIGIVVLILINISIMIVYSVNNTAHNWIDVNIFRKEVKQDKVTTIDLKENQNSSIYAFNKYIGVLSKAKLSIYSNTGAEEKSLDIQISDPLWSAANRFLAIAENKGQKLYVLTDKDISWEAEVDGNIAQVHINKNGYVAVVISDTSYKTVIKMYDSQGKPLFNTYLSSTRAVDVSISNDNKYLAIAEVDTSGTMIQSSIRIMSIDKKKKNETDTLENTYKCQENKLIANIKYQDKNRLVCMYTDSIHEFIDGKEEVLIENNNKKVTFQSINLRNNACLLEEKSSGLFTADSLINIVNIDSKQIKQYTAESVTKEIYTYGNIIAVNLGTEVEFINVDGWLVKRYVANQEITNIVVSDSIAGIIYRDKIEIINL